MRIVFAILSSSYYLVFACFGLLLGWLIVMRVRRGAGVWRLRYFAFPRPWLKYLHDHVPLYSRLPWELRARYQDKVLQFVDSKGFRACGTLDEVPESTRLTIAGNACLLLLNGSGEGNHEGVFGGLLAVQVYPLHDQNAEARSSCVAVLWDDTRQHALDPRDQGNAALGEIALALGWEAGGKPALPDPMLLTAWARFRSGEFIKGNPGLLEESAPGEPAEIFAVVTEMFLAAPALLLQKKPALYAALRQFYYVDPARWKLT